MLTIRIFKFLRYITFVAEKKRCITFVILVLDFTFNQGAIVGQQDFVNCEQVLFYITFKIV